MTLKLLKYKLLSLNTLYYEKLGIIHYFRKVYWNRNLRDRLKGLEGINISSLMRANNGAADQTELMHTSTKFVMNHITQDDKKNKETYDPNTPNIFKPTQ